MTTEIRHIVFDIGNVLVHYDATIPFKRIIPDDQKREWFLSEVCSGPWNHEQDRGRTWEEAEAAAIAEYPDEAENIRAFRKNWSEMIPYAHEDSVAVFRALLNSDLDVTLLTNFAADTFTECRARFPFLNETRGITISGEIGKVKPDRDIFEHHVQTLEITPAATLFIDDKRENVEGAKAAGWQAVQFIDAETLKRDLAAFGISVS
ncbi:HAD family hydrolase [Martelella mediterranea]|uniref:2-haloacid dehalogenase n=1 Tax=Martelella mediterranea TaxID=293089 RepID=A0A4V2V4I0_9HYPH|nr:HAD family phosphatase [Martelella mediterranea]TCT38869.1 2-haloacid dehalogenase [Martelella mediterranea]